jgi:hypothetical protein
MKILLVVESTHKYESGGRVVRYLVKILKTYNHDVKVLVLSEPRDDLHLDSFYKENNIEFLPLRQNLRHRWARLFFSAIEIRKFQDILKNFSPQIVHFASFDNQKSPQFISQAKKTVPGWCCNHGQCTFIAHRALVLETEASVTCAQGGIF